MRFISKSSNLMLVLKPGLPGNIQLGTTATSGVYVKFQGGSVDVKEESLIELMRKHPAFNIDFIQAEDEESDPFEYMRNDTEPAHRLTTIKYGHVEGSVGTKQKVKVSPELAAFIKAEATKMAQGMLPSMVKEVLNQIREEATAPTEDVEVDYEVDSAEPTETTDSEGDFIPEEIVEAPKPAPKPTAPKGKGKPTVAAK